MGVFIAVQRLWAKGGEGGPKGRKRRKERRGRGRGGKGRRDEDGSGRPPRGAGGSKTGANGLEED